MFKYIFLTLVIVAAVIFLKSYTNAQGVNEQNADKTEDKNIKAKGKVLVIYYSLSGNTREIALKIKEKTNADLYEIKTETDYPSSPMVYLTAKKQLNPKNYPKLKLEPLPDFSNYDLIFIGGPVWWYTVPAPLLAFFEQTDFKGKTVVSFATHGGNYGKYFENFQLKIKNAKVLRGLDFKKPLKTDPKILDAKISEWLNTL